MLLRNLVPIATALCLSSMVPFAALAACDICYANCGRAGQPTCDSLKQSCDACRSSEAESREAARKAAMQKTPEYKAVKKAEEVQKAVTSGTDAPKGTGAAAAR